MTRLLWDQDGERRYETGVDQGVLYLPTAGVYSIGYAWNGLTTVTESPSGAEPTPQYADNTKYLNLLSVEDFNATIEAFTYPKEFAPCDGSVVPSQGLAIGQQPRKTFGLSYRTRVGTDQNAKAGYKIHLVWGALAAPSEKPYATVNDSPEALNFSWEISTTPVAITTQVSGVTLNNSASMTIDSTLVASANLTALEDALYGTAGSNPRLPLPDEVIAMFAGGIVSATPTQPTFVSGTGVITIPSVTGIVYKRADTNATVPTGAMAAITPATPGTSLIIYAVPAAGYFIPAGKDTDWEFIRT